MNALPPGGFAPAPSGPARLQADLSLMAELAISACARGHAAAAAPLLAALRALAPDHAAPDIAEALDHLRAGEPDRAAAILRRVIAAGRRGAQDARPLLLLALAAGGRLDDAEAAELMNEIASGPDGSARRLAARLRERVSAEARIPRNQRGESR
jgi:hypothetical protein